MAGVRRREVLRRGNRRHAVSRHHRDEGRGLGSGGKQLRDAREHGVVVTEDAAQQGPPREVHRERRGQPAQRLRRVLGRRDDEERVRDGAPAQRAARGMGHRGGVRVEADYERVMALGRGVQHVATVARAEVDRNPGVG